MAAPLLRILSDIHYGDHASSVRSLSSLTPLLAGVDHLVLNGDTFDSRPSHVPAYTQELAASVAAFFSQQVPQTTFLTGNHDPDFSPTHALDLAGGQILVTHGDILFDDIVPWGMDAALARKLVAGELARLAPAARHVLENRLEAYRRAALAIPQRHQSERNPWKYRVRFARDTVWPPLRIFRILAAWKNAPRLARNLVATHRPAAKFIILGHTHRPGIWRHPHGATVINTGSYCPPLGGGCVDLQGNTLSLRRVVQAGGDFRAGPVIGQFTLADT